MKTLFITLVLICMISISCKKSNDNVSKNLALIQHNWKIVSLNGEALRYVGEPDDYFNFSANNILYAHAGGNNTLAIYSIMNGVKSQTPTNYTINVLSDTQFIISNSVSSPPVNIIDSLKR